MPGAAGNDDSAWTHSVVLRHEESMMGIRRGIVESVTSFIRSALVDPTVLLHWAPAEFALLRVRHIWAAVILHYISSS